MAPIFPAGIPLAAGRGPLEGPITLRALQLSAGQGTVGQAVNIETVGRTVGSTLSLTGAGAAGLAINNTTGVITGTPTTAGAVNIVESLTKAQNSPRTTSGFSIVEAPKLLNALTASVATGDVGKPVNIQISGRTPGSNLSIGGAGSAGLTINRDTALISGTPTTAGIINVGESLAGYSNSPRTTPNLVTITSAAEALQPLTLSLASGEVGKPFSANVLGKTPGSGIYLSGAGSAGLSISEDFVSGTPTQVGTVNLVETKNTANNSPRTSSDVASIAAATVTLGPLTVTPAAAKRNTAYSGQVTGRTAGSGLSLSGAGAAGLVVDGATGVISGTPTVNGAVNVSEFLNAATNTGRVSSGVVTVSDTGASVVLPDLDVSADWLMVGKPAVVVLYGYNAGSTITLSGAGAAGMSVVPARIDTDPNTVDKKFTTIEGTPTTAGPINVIETLASASNSPKTTTGKLTVVASNTLALMPLTLSALNGGIVPAAPTFRTDEAPGTVLAYISKTMPGSTLTLTPADGKVVLNAEGTAIVIGATAATVGTLNYNLVETLAGAVNSPKSTPFAVSVTAARTEANFASARFQPVNSSAGNLFLATPTGKLAADLVDSPRGQLAFAASVNEHSGNTKFFAPLFNSRLLVQLITNLARASIVRVVGRNPANTIVMQVDLVMELPMLQADPLPIVMVSWDMDLPYAADWAPNTNYNNTSYVIYNGKTYKSKPGNANWTSTTVFDATKWDVYADTPVSGFQAYLAMDDDPANDISVRPTAPTTWLQGATAGAQTINYANASGCKLYGGSSTTSDPDVEVGMFLFSPVRPDLSVVAQRYKYRPSQIGTDGSAPCGGVQPPLYITGDATALQNAAGINLGYGAKFKATIPTGAAILVKRTPNTPLPAGSPTGLRAANDPPRPGYVRYYCDDFKRNAPTKGLPGFYGRGAINEGGRSYQEGIHYPPFNFNPGTGEQNIFVVEDGKFRNGSDFYNIDPAYYRPYEFFDANGVGYVQINGGKVKEKDLALMGQPYWGGNLQTRDWVIPEDAWIEMAYQFPEAPWLYSLDGYFAALWFLGNDNGRNLGTYLEVDLLEQIGRLSGRQGSFLPIGLWKGTTAGDSTKYQFLNDFNQRGLYGPWSKVGMDTDAVRTKFWHNADEFILPTSDAVNGGYATQARKPKFIMLNMSSGNGRAPVQGQLPGPGKAWFNNIITKLTAQDKWCVRIDYVDIWVPEGTQAPLAGFTS